MALLKLAINSLTSKRHAFKLLLIVVAVSMLLLVLIDTAISGIRTSIYNQAALKYGTHHLVLNDLDLAERAIINQDSRVSESGVVRLWGSYFFQEAGINSTVGSFDQQAIEMSHIILKEGRFPIGLDEMAVESSYAVLLKLELGAQVHVTIDSIDYNLKVAGIVNDYSAYWTVPDYVGRGENDFPNLILSEEAMGNISLVTKLKNSLLVNLKNGSEENVYRFLEKYGEKEKTVIIILICTSKGCRNIIHCRSFLGCLRLLFSWRPFFARCTCS